MIFQKKNNFWHHPPQHQPQHNQQNPQQQDQQNPHIDVLANQHNQPGDNFSIAENAANLLKVANDLHKIDNKQKN